MSLITTDFYWPQYNVGSSSSAFQNVTAITGNASGKMAFIGRVNIPGGGTKTIDKITYRYGAVTVTGGGTPTTHVVSIQAVDTVNGPPFRPDGTMIAQATVSSISANTVTTTPSLTGTASVSHGDLIAVVIEYGTYNSGTPDSFNITCMAGGADSSDYLMSSTVSNPTGSSWTSNGILPMVMFTFTDVTLGSFAGTEFSSGFSLDTITAGGSDAEHGVEFQIPFACKCDGLWAYVTVNSTPDFTACLYDGSGSLLASSSHPHQQITSAIGGFRYMTTRWTPQTLSANTTYRATINASAGSTLLLLWSVPSSSYWPAFTPFTGSLYYVKRNAGSFGSATTTSRLNMGLHISAVDDGTGSGGPGGGSYGMFGG